MDCAQKSWAAAQLALPAVRRGAGLALESLLHEAGGRRVDMAQLCPPMSFRRPLRERRWTSLWHVQRVVELPAQAISCGAAARRGP